MSNSRGSYISPKLLAAKIRSAILKSSDHVAQITEVTCRVHDHGSRQCGSQCLILSYTRYTGMSGKDLRGMTVAKAEKARAAYRAVDRKSMGVEAGFVRCRMHNVLKGHANDAHLALHFFPPRLRSHVCTLVKLKEDGNVAVDVLDLRPARCPKPVST